jgi:hypothetical protein
VSPRLESIYTLQGKEPDQHIVHVTSKFSRMTTICEVSTKSKLVPCSQDEVLAPNNTQLSYHPRASFLLQQTTSKQEMWFGEAVTGLLGLPVPIKPDMQPVQIKACHRGQNDAVLTRHRRGLPHRNLRIATTLSLPYPSKYSTDPPTCPAWSSNSDKHHRYSTYPKYSSSP